MNIPFFLVDAFVTREPFSGNPAGICLLPGRMDRPWMQLLAAEINQAETAFLYPQNDGFHLQWFTPKMEVALCGHGTLASAHILWQEGILKKGEEARFYTQSGLLKASQKGDLIELDFPAKPTVLCEKPKGLEECLGTKVLSLGLTGTLYLAELSSDQAVRNVKPDFKLMESFLNPQLHGVIITAASDDPAYDFVSRFFAPLAGHSRGPRDRFGSLLSGPFLAKPPS